MNILRKEIQGVEQEVPLIDGEKVKYINFDNAASTPSLKRVLNKVNEFLKFYSSIHRGSGYKSRLSTYYYEKAREKAGKFVGFDEKFHTVIFVKNATEAINKLSYRLNLSKDSVIIVSKMEHHSNDLPWRDKGNVVHVPVNQDDGSLEIDVMKELIEKNKDKLSLVSITGASNVTGIVNPICEIAELVHKAGAYFMVDGAQLAPHKKIEMGKPGDLNSIDFLSYSAHKMYAPFGTGVLVARKDLIDNENAPEYKGGGTVKIVTSDEVGWDREPYVDEAGSPNVVGSIALAEAINFFNEVGYEQIEKTEMMLTEKLLISLLQMSDVEIYGEKDIYNLKGRLGVIPFNIKGFPHALVASILAYEYGIGVRSGCFCAQPYVRELLKINREKEVKCIKRVLASDRSDIPGMLRVSFGFYNEEEELDILIEALKNIIKNRKKYFDKYILDKKRGEYFPKKYKDNLEQYFKI